MTIVRGTAATLAGRVVNAACALGTTLLIARLLGPSGSGVYTMLVFLHSGLVMLASAGMPVANSYFIGKRLYSQEAIAANAVVTALLLGVSASAVGLGVLTLLKSSTFRDVPWQALFVALTIVPVAVLTQFLSGILLGANRVTTLAGLSLLGSLFLLTGVGLLAVVRQLTVMNVVALWAVSTCVVSAAYARAVFTTLPFAVRFDAGLFVKAVKFGAPSYLTNIISLFNLRLDVFLVGAFVGTAAVGHYGAAVAFAELSWYGASALATALYPRLTAAGREEALALLTRGARHAFITTAAIVLALLLVGRPLIPIVLGDAYRPSAALLVILLPGALLYGFAPVWSAFFTGHMGRPLISLAIAGLSLGLDGVLNVVFLPQYGVSAAAWSATAGYAVASVFAFTIVVKTTGLSWLDPFHIGLRDLAAYSDAFRHALGRRS